MKFLIPLLAIVLATPALAAKPTYPTLSAKDQETLAEGKLVLNRDYEDEDSGTIIGVQRINASVADVWKILLAFDRIPESNDSVVVSEDYTAEMGRTPPSGGRYIDIHYELKVAGQSIPYNVHHTYYPSQQYLEWTLDDQKDNDIEATEGSFTVWPVDGEPGKVDFLYITRIKTGRSVPGWVETLLTKTSLKGYIKFVKAEAER